MKKPSDLVIDVLCFGLERFNRWHCGKTTPGHAYDAELLLGGDETTYVLDPVVKCSYCGYPLPEKIYNAFVENIRLTHEEPDAELW